MNALDNKTFRRFLPYLIFTVGVIVCTFLLLHRLGHTYITPWDEVVHANVAHNLYADCCDPKLHSVDLGTDVEDTNESTFLKGGIVWTNNYIWLHKPPLPFYVRGGLYHAFGENLLVFRLPSVLFTLLTAFVLFFVAKRLSSIWVATCVALLFASNRFMFELAQGRQYSDLSDVMNACFLAIVLGLTLASAAGCPLLFSDNNSPTAYRLASLAAALFAAMAYLCKGGLALPGLVVFGITLVWQCGWRQSAGHVTAMALLFGALVLPEYLYFRQRFPRQFSYEQGRQIAHLFTDVEKSGRPWFYYLTVGWRHLLDLPSGLLGFAALGASLLPGLRSRRNLVLVLWVLIYVVPLSFAVSKVANFSLPIVPAIILLLGFCGHDIIHSEWRRLLYPLTGIFLVVLAVDSWFALANFDNASILQLVNSHRFLLLSAASGILLFFLLVSAAIKVPGLTVPPPSARTALGLVTIMCVSVIIQNSVINWRKSNSVPEDYQDQMALKATADRIGKQLPPGAVALIDESAPGDHRNDHLFFQYWSGINSLPGEQLSFAKRTLSRAHPLYMLARKQSAPNGTLIEKVPYGYLYKVN